MRTGAILNQQTFPLWSENNVDGRYYQTAFNNTNYGFTQTISSFGSSLSGDYRYGGAATAPNGLIFCPPVDAANILVINSANNTTSTIGSYSTGGAKWLGIVLAPNGFLYTIPFNSTQILKINPITLTITPLSATITGSAKYMGGVVAENGLIYCIPYNATQVLVINPFNDTTYFLPDIITGGAKYRGGTSAKNGLIYCPPNNSENILVINPFYNTTHLLNVTTITGTNKYHGSSLAKNGNIYCIPWNETRVLEIVPSGNKDNPTTGSINFYLSLSTGLKWIGCVTGPDGLIYGIPGSATQVIAFNPVSKTASLFGNISGGDKFYGGGLDLSGRIICVPYRQSLVHRIGNIQTIANNFTLSRYNNRF